MVVASELTSQLEAEYCPPLDSATFLAILSDYDINHPEDLKAARVTLDVLLGGIDVEEASGFDPSGSSGRDVSHAEVGSESTHSQQGWGSYTDDTSLSQGMSALDLDGSEFSDTINPVDEESEGQDTHLAKLYKDHLESLNDASKMAVLVETFPGIRPFDIKWTLNKCKGKASLAIDELLNQVFLEGAGHRYQGVDAFSESELPPRPRKGKGKKKKRIPNDGDASSLDSQVLAPGVSESKWETAARDVDFISSRTRMPPQQVKSIYHENGASISATISAIIDAYSSTKLESEDPAVAVNVRDLSNDFPTIPLASVLILTQITHPSTTAAHELAKALIARPTQVHNGPNIKIEFRLSPPDLDSPISKPKPKSHNAVYTDDLPPTLLSHSSPSADSKDYIALRNSAFTKASSAYRRGKSDHLMSGAAAYYSTLGRTYDAAAKFASSAAADALVTSNSSTTTLELHGVSVKDAVRIARESVTTWWARHGSSAGNGGTHTGYQIVTGKGTHSEGGKGKLGPAVAKMLIRGGWKIEVGSGVLIVTGVVRKAQGVFT